MQPINATKDCAGCPNKIRPDEDDRCYSHVCSNCHYHYNCLKNRFSDAYGGQQISPLRCHCNVPIFLRTFEVILGQSRVSRIIKTFYRQWTSVSPSEASIACAHCSSMIPKDRMRRLFNRGYHFNHCDVCEEITCLHCLGQGGRYHDVSQCCVRCVCGYVFRASDRASAVSAGSTIMACGCGLSMCYVCHKKDDVCSCGEAGDTEDSGPASEDDDPTDEE